MLVRKVVGNFNNPMLVLHRNYHKIGIVGVPFNKGQPKNGVDKGPAALRETGVLDEIIALDPRNDIKDYGDIQYTLTEDYNVANMKNYLHVNECNRKLASKVSEIIKDNRICLTFGGDHSIGIGTIYGHASTYKDPDNLAILWIDAHADINSNRSTYSGNIHGMPLGILAKELYNEWDPLPKLEWLQRIISVKNLAYIGLRSVDSYERDIIDKFNITAFDMRNVERYGIHKVIQMALERIDPNSNRSIHVSFDIDSLDVLEAPSTGTAVRGGLTLREGIEIMETVTETGRLKAMDLVEVNPLIGTVKDVQITLEAAKEILLATFNNYKKIKIN